MESAKFNVQWKFCNEELPEKSGRYLTFCDGNLSLTRTFIYLFFNERQKDWSGNDVIQEVYCWLDGDIESKLIEERQKRINDQR